MFTDANMTSLGRWIRRAVKDDLSGEQRRDQTERPGGAGGIDPMASPGERYFGAGCGLKVGEETKVIGKCCMLDRYDR